MVRARAVAERMPSDPELIRQVRVLRAFAALTYPFACVPFLWFWFDDLGITPPQYASLISAYYLTMVVAEVPTGLLADRFGARQALLLGPLVLAAGFATIGSSTTYAGFLAGEILLGLGHSILSGPPSALLFDSLRRAGRSEEFHRHEAIANTFRLLGTAVAFLIGGVLVAARGIPASIHLTAILCAGASGVAWFARDLPRAPPPAAGAPPPPSLLRGAVGDLRDPSVAWLLGYYVVLFCLLRFPFHTYQPYLREVGAEDPLSIGALFFALNLFAAPFSRLTPWLSRYAGRRALFWAMPTGIGLSLLFMAGRTDGLGIALFFVHQVPFGMHWAVVQDFANHRIRGRARATVLSILSFAGRVAFAGLFPLVMALDDLESAYVVVGIVGTVATAVAMVAGRGLLRA
jgi:MFS family permease